MRMILALPLLMVAACDVQKDAANDQTTYELNEQKIESATDNVGDAVENVVSDVGNAAEGAGKSIKNQVDNVDISVDVKHKQK